MATLVTGATGLVGGRLLEQLSGDIIATSRNATRAKRNFGDAVKDVIQWSPTEEQLHLHAEQNISAVVNLMGDPVNKGRWTKQKKQSIRDSRVIGTANLVDAVSRLQIKPKVFVSASAVGFYGDRGDEVLTETSQAGKGFLAEVCQEWEDATRPLADAGIRCVTVRIGIVLAKDGGALKEMLPIFRLGIGGPLGSGGCALCWM